MKRMISLTINGKRYDDAIADNLLLIDYLRDVRKLTGAKRGCDGGECGACSVLVDKKPHLSCITLAAMCDGAEIETIEGQANQGKLTPLQRSFHENLGAQCGFCTPGMIMTAEALLRENPDPDEDQIKAALGGNLCRCTGFIKIVKSVQAAAKEMQ